MTEKATRERNTATIRTLVTPTMRLDVERWALRRNLSLSTALRIIIADALAREPETASEPSYQALAVQARRPAERGSEAAPGA